MALKALKCPNCNANIQVEDDRDYGFCSYCGAQIQVREVVEIRHSGMVKMEQNPHFEQLMENGNAYLKMNDYYRAEMEFMGAIREYPGKASGYEGLIRTITRDYTIFLIENQERVHTLLDKMMAVAKEDEKAHCEQLCQKVKEDFRKGALQQTFHDNRIEIERLGKVIKENTVFAVGMLLFNMFLQSVVENSLFRAQLGFLLCVTAIVVSLVAVSAKVKRDKLMETNGQLEEECDE